MRISDKRSKVKSVPRNPNIITFFRFARQGENAGYGIDKIMRWTKLTSLEVDFESDRTSSTVIYPLPLQKSGQKGGRIIGGGNDSRFENCTPLDFANVLNVREKSIPLC